MDCGQSRTGRHLGSLETLARNWAGGPPAQRAAWASAAEDLAGEGGELANVLAYVPTRRLVVLGEPGAGKTILMVRLVLDMLVDRAPGGQVPFLVPLASWNPKEQELRAWLADRMTVEVPALAAPGVVPVRAENLVHVTRPGDIR